LKYENLRDLRIIEGIEKENGKGVKSLEGIGLKKVEVWRFWCVVL